MLASSLIVTMQNSTYIIGWRSALEKKSNVNSEYLSPQLWKNQAKILLAASLSSSTSSKGD